MGPGRRVRSEYMKRFQAPPWEACGPRYRELLRYRRARRLLEQAHWPWPAAGPPEPPPGPRGPEPQPKESLEPGEQRQSEEPAEKNEVDKQMGPRGAPRRPSALPDRGDQKPPGSPQRAARVRENKHPFALYGWGEKQTDTGAQKTHNVCASASTREIHASAIRAKNRNQAEKRKMGNERQRNPAEDGEKPRRAKPPSAESPWVTEYMRCYSARVR
ncbi:centriole, cilia and spindle-associated protein [Tachyglossus aculeatus]|uniref:centriole, cilia and spindle-associated protein n=1 Tax=Tachyglossus aculeatus TaxID=9261 RepID=UPI0018F4F5A4|nr:centriole, cilia and spindle-associated protein [Tachyglossus aculeatus]